MSSKITLSENQIQDIIRLYTQNRETSREIGKKYNVSNTYILELLKKNNIKPIDRRCLKSFDLKKDIIPLYKKGISLTKLAKQFHTSREYLSKHLKELGVEIINRQNETKFNENVFDIIDTEEKAYWLGFIYADGYISSSPLNPNKKSRYAFELSLSAKDTEHLYKFNKFMGSNKDNVKISKVKVNNKEFTRCRWSIVNKHLWFTLYKLGCIPNKSLILKFPKLSIFLNPKNLVKHFVRGYIDGDGCISYIKTNPKDINSNYSPSVSILGTKDFLTVLSYYMRRFSPENLLIENANKENSSGLTYNLAFS